MVFDAQNASEAHRGFDIGGQCEKMNGRAKRFVELHEQNVYHHVGGGERDRD